MAYSYSANSYYLHEYTWREAFTWYEGITLIEEGCEAVKFHFDVKPSEIDLQALGKALQNNQTLRGLYISTIKPNYIENFQEALSELFVSLEGNKTLETLDLRDCSIGDDGAVSLAECLKVNTGIQYVDLLRNGIASVGARALASMLKENTTLRYLYIEENPAINTEGCVALAKGVYDNTTLMALSFRACACSRVAVRDITNILLFNNNLRILYWPDWKDESDEFFNYQNWMIDFNILIDEAIKANTSIVEIYYHRSPLAEKIIIRNRDLEKKRILDLIAKLDNKIPWLRCKLMVVGQGRAGKSATVRSLTGERYDPLLESTIGASLTQTRTAANDASWNRLNDESRVGYLTSAVEKIVAAAPKKLMDLNNIPTETTGLILKEGPITPTRLSIDPIPNKEVSVKPFSTAEEEFEVAKRFDHKLIARAEAQAYTIETTIWDYGGQRVFYALHHLFLTQYGVYMLVFDMREMVKNKERALQYILFWLNSIKLHAEVAPVLLLGTFLDQVSNTQMKIINREFRKVFRDRFPQVVPAQKELLFFPLSNANGEGIDDIRCMFDTVARKQEFLWREVSVRWIRWLDKSQEYTTSGRPFINLQEARSDAVKLGIKDSLEVEAMLDLFHELGMVIHFNTTPILNELITLQPQWLIDNISKVIRDRNIHQYMDPKISQAGLENDVRELFENALASQDLLEYLWGKEQCLFFIDLMRRTLLLSDYAFSEETYFLIPSLLQKRTDKKQIRKEGKFRCVFDFSEGWLPNGVFQRLVCLLVAHSATLNVSEEPYLEQNYCDVSFGPEGHVFLVQENDSISMSMDVASAAARFLRVVKSMLDKVNQDTMKGRLTWNIKFPKGSSYLAFEKAKKTKLAPWFDGREQSGHSSAVVKGVVLDDFLSSI